MSSGAAYAENQPVQIHVVSQSPHTFAYRLWVGRPTDPDWQWLDEGDITTPPKSYGPYPAGTKIDYYLLIGGKPYTDWQVQVFLNQNGQQLQCSPPPERGTTNDKAVADRESVATLA